MYPDFMISMVVNSSDLGKLLYLIPKLDLRASWEEHPLVTIIWGDLGGSKMEETITVHHCHQDSGWVWIRHLAGCEIRKMPKIAESQNLWTMFSDFLSQDYLMSCFYPHLMILVSSNCTLLRCNFLVRFVKGWINHQVDSFLHVDVSSHPSRRPGHHRIISSISTSWSSSSFSSSSSSSSLSSSSWSLLLPSLLTYLSSLEMIWWYEIW